MRLPGLHRLQPRLSASPDKGGRDPRKHAADPAQPDLLRRSDGRFAGSDRGRPARRIRASGGRRVSAPVLGRPAPLPASPGEAQLATVANPHPGLVYLVRFTCPEFTSLCPVTGQPDFAHFVIDYAPDATLIESKSLKLFLAAFRNHAAFHEDCTLIVARRLVAALAPRWLRLAGYWYPRGGIPIDVFYQTAAPPAGLWLPEPGVAPYRGRG